MNGQPQGNYFDWYWHTLAVARFVEAMHASSFPRQDTNLLNEWATARELL